MHCEPREIEEDSVLEGGFLEADSPRRIILASCAVSAFAGDSDVPEKNRDRADASHRTMPKGLR